MLVLGIETSCDETAAAVVRDGREVLSDVVSTQIEIHRRWGGVVPELASRNHVLQVMPVIDEAMEKAGVALEDIDGIAVTSGPGLSGALLVGVQLAQALAWARGKPIVGVDHLVGHLLAVFLQHPERQEPAPELPFIALLVSGGHTAIYRVDGTDLSAISELGATRDDAAGEAFDKVAKLLGLGYPGGPIIDRLAAKGDPERVPLALPMRRQGSLEFSFSGLKTNVARWVESHGPFGDEQRLYDLCASFQRNVVESLLGKTFKAARAENIGTVVLAGGVAANRGLRERAAAYGARYGIRVVVPHRAHCTDNAAMIAFAGSLRLARGEDQRGQLVMSPHTALERVTRKGKGRR